MSELRTFPVSPSFALPSPWTARSPASTFVHYLVTVALNPVPLDVVQGLGPPGEFTDLGESVFCVSLEHKLNGWKRVFDETSPHISSETGLSP